MDTMDILIATQIGNAVLQVCQRQVSKQRPLDSLNISAIVERTLREAGQDEAATLLSKARELDRLMGELKKLGFAEDEPINGGDCVEAVSGIYERLVKLYPNQ